LKQFCTILILKILYTFPETSGFSGKGNFSMVYQGKYFYNKVVIKELQQESNTNIDEFNQRGN